MTTNEKKYKLLKSFLDTYEVEGICEFLITEDEDHDGVFSVYIVFDIDWLKTIPTKPEFVAKRYRHTLLDEIKNFTGIEVSYVGSTARKCDRTS